MSDAAQVAQVPLLDRLKSVPADARAWYEHHGAGQSHIPYGRLCQEAVERIEGLEAGLRTIYALYPETEKEVKEALSNE